MKNLKNELDELMEVARVNGLRRKAFRQHFSELALIKQKEFIENFQWEIIKTTNENNYSYIMTKENTLIWDWIDECWEAQSSACYEPGDHMTWRFKQNSDGLWVDDSSEELRINKVIKAVFMSPTEAKTAYQKWENEIVEAFINDYQRNYK